MATKINFKNFHKGDDVVITVLDDGNEEILSGKITSISLSKKVIHLEDNDSEYECKFSEIKSVSLLEEKTSNIRTFSQKISKKKWLSLLIPIIIGCLFYEIELHNAIERFEAMTENRIKDHPYKKEIARCFVRGFRQHFGDIKLIKAMSSWEGYEAVVMSMSPEDDRVHHRIGDTCEELYSR